MMSGAFPNGLPPLSSLSMFPSVQSYMPQPMPLSMGEPLAKRLKYETEWMASSGSSPSHSEDSNTVPTSASASALTSANTRDSACTEPENDVTPAGQTSFTELKPSFTELKPYVPPSVVPSMSIPSTSADPLYSLAADTRELIHLKSKFYSYQEFEEVFERWKLKYLHPMRVASSEALRDDTGVVNAIFKYRYVVFHCAHYGEPRMRGNGKRPNQNYLPCGCKAMLRLNYSFPERCLTITTLTPYHTGHELTLDSFNKVNTKIRRSIAVASRRSSLASSKQEPLSSPVTASTESPVATTTSRISSNPATAATTRSNSPNAAVPQVPVGTVIPQANPMFAMQQHMMQQQMMSAYAMQQQQQLGQSGAFATPPATAFNPMLVTPQMNALAAAYLQQQQQMFAFLAQQKENSAPFTAAVPMNAASSPEATSTAEQNTDKVASEQEEPVLTVPAAAAEPEATAEVEVDVDVENQITVTCPPLPANVLAPVPIRPVVAPHPFDVATLASPMPLTTSLAAFAHPNFSAATSFRPVVKKEATSTTGSPPPILLELQSILQMHQDKENQDPSPASDKENIKVLCEAHKMLTEAEGTVAGLRHKQLMALVTHWHINKV